MNIKDRVSLVHGLLLILALSIVPFIMACSQQSAPNTNKNSNTNPNTNATTGTTSVAKAPKKVTVAVVSEPDTLDPTTSKMTPVSYPIANNIFERLIDVTPNGDLVPGLASWQVSPDGKEVEFTLRKGIKFQNGDPLTARDVEFSHNRALKNVDTYQRSMRQIDRVEVLDDYRVKFVFKNPDVTFLPNRALFIVSKNYYDKVGEEEFLKKPVGTGPYKFVEWKPGQYIDIEANEDYWGEKPQIKQARLLFVKEDTARIAKLKAGEVDLIMDTPFPLVKDVENAGFKTVKVPAHPTTSIQFHNNNPETPWYKRQVRLAIAHAVDGDSIVKNLFQGVPARYARLAPWELGYDPDLKPYLYDPAKAKQLLVEAGYPNGFDMPLYYFAGRASGQKETAEAVVLSLNAIGIRAKAEGIEAVQMLDKTRQWHSDPKAVFVGVTTVPLAHYPEPTEALDTGYFSGSTIGLYFNPEFDGLVTKMRVTVDNAKRAELIKQGVKVLHDDVATIPIWANISVYAMGKDIDFTPTLKSRDPLILIKDVKVRN